MNLFGNSKKFVATLHHVPLGIDAHAAEQGDMSGEQFRDSASVGRGVEVEHAGSLERLGQSPNLFNYLISDHGRVVFEVLF
ncbi:unannotated protein [freshwater metagenome]|uniref:Unannotated protein n=1 Tax=freshwater metagenome TaxID=449393 RepID=A0A6J7NEX6_9ZZZZ